MSYAEIHPNWETLSSDMLDGYSLEITAKDVPSLREAAPMIAPQTPIAVTFLPGEEMEDRINAVKAVRELGFEPMPHVSARRIQSQAILENMLEHVTGESGVKRIFLIAGDPPQPEGPFADSLQIIRTGLLEKNGIKAIGIAGHPEGHPNVSRDDLWVWMENKIAEIRDRGMLPIIVTQFGFSADPFLEWLEEMRARGIDAPVRIGVPGPAGIKRLLGFAARCGVGASAAVMAKYGVSLTKLMGTAGPDKLVGAIEDGLDFKKHGRVRLHFYPFGGLSKTLEWIHEHEKKRGLT
ncbi:methylenetetrahydrofolate reductase [Hyphococcus luteus]|uniref:Methylenetetrahydrofolate reductase n=1 Tax=Hyphococcus luteus TaxID=2058213 RepID=A0A2S7KAN1_9PROT|nr:methylenetetrahydrofolate reductase [Marinicaulis flavus]PQA89555.1 5,10-methylenetetrahydrofolate reductase [Marinicaulis flavus]